MDDNFRKRVRRRLYYGQEDLVDLDKPSLPLTEFTVEYFKESVSQKLGHVDLDIATNLINKNSVSPCSMVLSLLYAKRLRQQNKDYLGSISSSDVFFISMMLASKYIYDEGVEEEVYNDEWAESVDQEVEDVNSMETDFLDALDWSLFVKPDEFEAILTDIERNLALRAGLHRGWFTYSELTVLMDSGLFTRLWNNVGLDCSKVSAVLSAAYMSCTVSLMASAALAAQVSTPLSGALVSGLSTHLAPMATHLAPMALTGLTLMTSLRPTLPLGLMQDNNLLSVQNMSGTLIHPIELSLPLLTGPLSLLPGCKGGSDDCFKHLSSANSAGFDGNELIAESYGNREGNSAEYEDKSPDIKSPDVQSQDGAVGPSDGTVPQTSADPPPKGGRLSMVSLWLVKSLLSQLWSVSSRRTSCPGHPAKGNAAPQHCSCTNCIKRKNRRKTANQTSDEPKENPIIADNLDDTDVVNQEHSADHCCVSHLFTLLEHSGIPFTSLPNLSDLVESACSNVKCVCKETCSYHRTSLSYGPSWDHHSTKGKLLVEPSTPSHTIGPLWHPSACVRTAIEVT